MTTVLVSESGVVLDWTRTGSAGPARPCAICGLPAICRAPSGKPCHKTCAETWTATHRPHTGASAADAAPTLGVAA